VAINAYGWHGLEEDEPGQLAGEEARLSTETVLIFEFIPDSIGRAF